MKISMASDHGGFELKESLKQWLTEQGHEVCDYGCHSKDSCDYPDFAGPAARAVADGACERGIVICTTGIGVSISANKVKGVRCAHVTDCFSAEATRQHNDANMLALGARVTGEGLALKITDIFLSTPYSGAERHTRRISKITAYEDGCAGE